MLFTTYKMLTMKPEKWISSLVLCLTYVSSNGEQHCPEDCNKKVFSAPLGSSVLLECNFSKSNTNNEWVSWLHMPDYGLLKLNSAGRIQFMDPRYGRVTVFPNQGSDGNYSIHIDKLQDSDLGGYCCVQGQNCLQAELVAERDTMSEEMQLLIYTSAGAAVLTLLMIGCYFCVKCTLNLGKTLHNYVNNQGGTAPTEAISHPPAATGDDYEEEDRGSYINVLVYENDEFDPGIHQNQLSRNDHGQRICHDLNRSSLNQSEPESSVHERRKSAFHTELICRIQQPNVNQDYKYYANQSEIIISAQQDNVYNEHEYKNPIYNRSTNHLNQL
ncbi:uncharacterized protein LOC117508279 isoform X2 [Thalassophryne amazonica]|uniref:uncharacterized protein LOC117508279 isoform X2 n=1 Tax=Thalassophryne amazonica TaxID=390379 RepID=UPI001470C9A2|nr:uncharacterized protein LOC117508279 isoform X2 [Thalassophryne amazonica]